MKIMDWKIFTDSTSSEKAHKILQKVISELGTKCNSQAIEPYHKGGFVCSFSSEIEESTWSQAVLQTLCMAQKIGRSWVVTGNISEELDAWSNDSLVPGVQNIHLVFLNNA